MYNLYNLEPNFKNFLIAENVSRSTLKNYLSDFRHFAGWLSNNQSYKSLSLSNSSLSSPTDVLKLIDFSFIEFYKLYLINAHIPIKTINRRLSAIRCFFKYCINQNLITSNACKNVSNISKATSNMKLPIFLSLFKHDLEIEEKSNKDDVSKHINNLNHFITSLK